MLGFIKRPSNDSANPPFFFRESDSSRFQGMFPRSRNFSATRISANKEIVESGVFRFFHGTCLP